VGVYDLQVMKQEGDITDRASGRRCLDRVPGMDVAKRKARSPSLTHVRRNGEAGNS
jgi:hypothetical protein